MKSKDSIELDKVAEALRETLQALLKRHVKSKSDFEELAKVLGKSPGHIKHMVYNGEGGLDSWVKAFAYAYDLDAQTVKNLSMAFTSQKPASESDKLLHKMKQDFNPSEDKLLYIYQCVYEAVRIANELEMDAKPSRKRKRKPAK